MSSENKDILLHKPQVLCVCVLRGGLKMILESEHLGRTLKTHSLLQVNSLTKLIFSKSDKLVPAGTGP